MKQKSQMDTQCSVSDWLHSNASLRHFCVQCCSCKLFTDLSLVSFQFKNAGIIEMEASIKACRVLIMQQVSECVCVCVCVCVA